MFYIHCMKVSFLQNQNYQSAPTFQRRLRDDEKPEFEKTMNEAFDYLGVNNRALIVHGSSFPSDKALHQQNISPQYYLAKMNGKNPYIGSPYLAKDFTDFVKMNGFNAIQLGPNGKLNKRDSSPYHASVFAKNELFLNFEYLKKDAYANILSDKDFKDIDIMKKRNRGNYDMADFDEAKAISKMLTKRAYNNFKTQVLAGNPKALALNDEFAHFKNQNDYWLEKDSVFRLFSDIHGSDNFEKWDNELDKNIVSLINQGDKAAITRYYQVKNKPRSAKKIDEYKFIQFLVDKQEKEDKVQRGQNGIKYIGDLLVGFSYADEWANPDAFLKDWRVGCPNGGKNGGPQLWNIAVLNPSTLFNEDGSLGVSGQLLKNKIERTLDGVENIRVDHVMWLVDPYIYKSSAVRDDGTIDVSNRSYLSHMPDIDPDGNYPKIMHKILLPTLREHGIDPKDVVWEDLGSQSQKFQDVFYGGKYFDEIDGQQVVKEFDDEKMTGIMYSKGNKMEGIQGPRYSFMATHDNEPSAQLLQQDWIYSNEGWNPMYLAGYLIPPYNEEQAKKSAKFCQEIEQNQETRLKAKYAELFRGTPNIQVMFSDFFGIDKTYNVGGQDNNENWKLRLNPNYEETYHKSIVTGEEPVMNMPELLSIAVNSKAGLSIAKGEKSEYEATSEIADLNARLNHWKKVLKEPEN